MNEPIIELAPAGKAMLSRHLCPYCEHPVQADYVTAQGTRNSKGVSCYWYEIHCKECNQPSQMTLQDSPMTTRGLTASLVEMYGNGTSSIPHKSRDEIKPKASGISDREFQNAKDIMNNAKSYEDVLRQFGISQREIDEMGKDTPDEGQ